MAAVTQPLYFQNHEILFHMNDFFTRDSRNALESIEFAQFIAFAPIVFEASLSLRDLGILELVHEAGKDGIDAKSIEKQTGLPAYGVRVLLEAALGIGLMTIHDNKYALTKTGYYILKDEMTRANMDFVQDINYRGMYDLAGSVRSGKPTGLKTLGDWPTVYEGLSKLKPKEQESWFAFDHFYSSDSFPIVLPHVFSDKPRKILDIGGNTGKWALQCMNHDKDVKVTIADLPGQLDMARKTIDEAGFGDRVDYFEINLLREDEKLPAGYDAVWMSQFLDCFSEQEIISILKRCRDAVTDNGFVYILEPFWDRQKFRVSAFCLQMTSLYFTNIANGNSQMYHSGLFTQLVEGAGYRVAEIVDNIGVSHSLLKCRKI